jgi:hypothetical protein
VASNTIILGVPIQGYSFTDKGILGGKLSTWGRRSYEVADDELYNYQVDYIGMWRTREREGKLYRPSNPPKRAAKRYEIHRGPHRGKFLTTTPTDWDRYGDLYESELWDGRTPGDLWRPKPCDAQDLNPEKGPGVRIFKNHILVFETTRDDWHDHWDVYHSEEWDGETHAALWQPPIGSKDFGDWTPPPWRSPFPSTAHASRLSVASTACGSTEPQAPAEAPESGTDAVFLGRADELKDLSSHLLPHQSQSSPMYYLISGSTGVGKTRLAKHWLHSNADKFAEAFWIDSSEQFQLDLGFYNIARMFKLVETGNFDFNLTRERVHDWFAKANTPWLICFDGASDLALLETYLPLKGLGSILITSQIDPEQMTVIRNLRNVFLIPFQQQELPESVEVH